MDSEHRHELNENDLANFLTHFGQFWAKYGNGILAVLAIAALGFAGWRWASNSRTAAHESAWTDLATATSPESLRQVAHAHSDPAVGALALLNAADLLLAESSRPQSGDPPATSLPDDAADNVAGDDSSDPAADNAPVLPSLSPEQALQDAQEIYQQIAEDQSLHIVYRLNAQLGLGAVAESQEDWQAARDIYQAVEAQAPAGFAAIKDQATRRLAQIDQLSIPLLADALPRSPPPAPPAPPASEDPAPSVSPAESPGGDAVEPVASPTTAPAETQPAPEALPDAAPADGQ